MLKQAVIIDLPLIKNYPNCFWGAFACSI